MDQAGRRSHVLDRVRLCLAAAMLVVLCVAARGQETGPPEPAPPEPDGYRLENYRAPTPIGLKGARTVTTAEAAVLWRDGTAVLVDVVAQVKASAYLPAGTVYRAHARYNVSA